MSSLLPDYGREKKPHQTSSRVVKKTRRPVTFVDLCEGYCACHRAAPAVSEDKWSIRQLLNSLHLFFPPDHSLSSSSTTVRLTLHARNLFWAQSVYG